MPTETQERAAPAKRRKKTIELLLAGLAIVLALTVTGVVLAAALDQGEDPPPDAQSVPTSQSGETTGPTGTEAPTEPTAPPPEANPYGPLDFVYRQGYLTCTAGPSELGIDVSEFQTVTDWDAVRDAGVEFVMIRVAYRTYEDGAILLDERAQEFYEGASAAGLKIGAYIFSQATTPEEATQEAVTLINAVKDWQIDMPLVFDWEHMGETSRVSGIDRETLTACTRIFCELVEAAGYEPMFYFNQNQARDLLDLSDLKEFNFWLAMYTERMNYPYRLSMWQYSCTGEVPGIEGDVDLDLYFPVEKA